MRWPLSGTRSLSQAHLEQHLAAAEVEAARRVLEHGHRRPDGPARAALAGGDLPAQRRAPRVDAGAARRLCLDRDAHQQPRQRLFEAQVHRVAGDRYGRERGAIDADGPRDAGVDGDVAPLLVAVHDIGRRRQRLDRAALGDLEDDRLLVGRAHRADLRRAGLDRQRLGRRRREQEAHLRARRRRRAHRHAEQLEQVDVDLVRHAIEPVGRHLGHPREQLDQRDAGIGDVVLGPLRAAARDPRASLRHELLKAAVVEHDLGQPHHETTSASRTSCVPPSSGMT